MHEGSKQSFSQFSTTSGPAQHIESGACDEAMVTSGMCGKICAEGDDEGYGIWRAKIVEIDVYIYYPIPL